MNTVDTAGSDGLRARVVEALRTGRDLGPLIGELRTLPSVRGGIAAEAVEIIVTGNQLGDPRRWPEIDELLELAEGEVPESAAWSRVRTIAAATSLVGSLVDGRSIDPGDVSARLDALAGNTGGDIVTDTYLSTVRSALQWTSSLSIDDPAALRDTLDAWSRGAAALGGAAEPVARAASEATSLIDVLSGGARLSDERLRTEAARADRDDTGDIDSAMRHMTVSAAALRGGAETDRGRVDLAVEHARRAVDRTEPRDAHRVVHLTGLALALLRRYELDPSTTDDLGAARDHLEDAWRQTGDARHPQRQLVGEMLSEVRRHLGDGADVQGPALEGLREHVWRVLVQDDPAAVRRAVRTAADDAIDVAHLCLSVGDPVGAVTALDSGRGLALYAATATLEIGDLLEGIGRPEQAARWRSAVATRDPAALPGVLRREVLGELGGTDGGALLDPPDLDRVGRALRAVDADALAYLVPGKGGFTGHAVVVSAGGRAGHLVLANLAVEHYPAIEEYLAMAARRDAAGLTAESVDDEFGDVLDALCTWAWGAAMGKLIESYLVHLPEPPGGRPRHVVLVPMGDLARVPWHAARDPLDRYAVERVAVSQVASARMLCRLAELPAVPTTSGGLVVGDPENTGEVDLVKARVEAYAIHQSFYRAARYLGRRPNGTPSPSGAGNPDEVTGWFTSDDPADGTVAHLACHGAVRAAGDEPTAHLLLADGGRVRADELVALRTGRAIGLVVLSGCRTGGSSRGHDEAFSLGTALLAGGVRSVLCTHWNTLDGLHGALMYMVHHLHRAEGLPVWEAVHRARLWALDPARTIPETMPDRLRGPSRSGGLSRATVWASVAHWGR